MAKPKKAEVGYCKAPVHTQFQPGQSGNPKGRPKSKVNLATALERALNEKVSITESGRSKKITKLSAAVKQLANKAATGDPRALQMLLNLGKEGGVRTKRLPEAPQVLTQADELVMQSVVKRIREHLLGDEDAATIDR